MYIKKLIIEFLSIFLLMGTTMPVLANTPNQQVQYFDDGSYIITVIEDETSNIEFYPLPKQNQKPLPIILLRVILCGALL